MDEDTITVIMAAVILAGRRKPSERGSMEPELTAWSAVAQAPQVRSVLEPLAWRRERLECYYLKFANRR